MTWLSWKYPNSGHSSIDLDIIFLTLTHFHCYFFFFFSFISSSPFFIDTKEERGWEKKKNIESLNLMINSFFSSSTKHHTASFSLFFFLLFFFLFLLVVCKMLVEAISLFSSRFTVSCQVCVENTFFPLFLSLCECECKCVTFTVDVIVVDTWCTLITVNI